LRKKIKMGTVMENRRRFLMAANALLYFGPLLAGLGGFGWGFVAVFTLFFVLWLIILQPMEFPINRAEWLSADAWVAVSARAAVQLLLVVVLFGIGRGIGGILGAIPAFPVMLPLAISFLSIPLARMIWDPWAQPLPPPITAPDPIAPAEAAEPKPAAPDTTKPN
jgi:hypothetical protein